jgi:hypothetical protein
MKPVIGDKLHMSNFLFRTFISVVPEAICNIQTKKQINFKLSIYIILMIYLAKINVDCYFESKYRYY